MDEMIDKFINVCNLLFPPYHLFYTTMANPNFHAGGNVIDEYTKIGKWFNRMPLIVSVVKIPYYCVMWPLTIVVGLIIGIVMLFLPRGDNG
jgi:hypothetical protein